MELIGLYLIIYFFGFSVGFRLGQMTGYLKFFASIKKNCQATIQLERKLALVGKSIKDLSEQELSRKLAEILEDPKEPDLY